ncbi:MAG: serine/threonine-protein kinase [Myxococcota bacterium]
MGSRTTSVAPLEVLKQRNIIHLGTLAFVCLLSLVYNRIAIQYEDWLREVDFFTPTVIAAIAFGGAAALIKWVARSHTAVNVFAVIGILVGCATFAEMVKLTPPELRPEMMMTLFFAILLMSRSALVPERPRVTIVLSTLLYLPLIVVTYKVHVNHEAPETILDPPLTSKLAYISFLWFVVELTAVMMSRVIYGLRREVNAAKQLGQYTLEQRLGGGGMGNVYCAQHALLQRPTAVKLIRFEDPTQRDALVSRFEHEVKLTAQLTHPNTITIYDYGQTEDGVFYYAMELLDGASLEEIVTLGGPMPPARVLHTMVQACAALREAHGRGFIHRDIKPGNIMLSKIGGMHDVVKVLDFGLVKDLAKSGDVGTTQAGAILGTPHYMAPEASSGKPLDARADVYALGAVGYFLLTGKPVFAGNTPIEVLGHHLHTAPEPLKDRVNGELPAGLEDTIMHALAKPPEERPEDAGALLRQLDSIARETHWSSKQAREWWDEYELALSDLRQEAPLDNASRTMIRRAS